MRASLKPENDLKSTGSKETGPYSYNHMEFNSDNSLINLEVKANSAPKVLGAMQLS